MGEKSVPTAGSICGEGRLFLGGDETCRVRSVALRPNQDLYQGRLIDSRIGRRITGAW